MMRSMEKYILLIIISALTSIAKAQTTVIDNYPIKPVRFVLSFGAPGGAPDIIARLVAPKLSEVWGQQMVIDARTGAGGIIGTEIGAKAAPDGYTYLITSPSHAINPALYSKLPYDPISDFTPVSQLADVPNIVVVHPSVPARSVKELMAYAKANPGKLNYGSAGSGSSQHLAGELFSKMAGVKLVHVPYKSGPAAVIDLVAGQVQLTFGSSSALPNVRAGKLFALAVTTSKRVGSLPDMPTVSEAGLPGYEASAWYAMFGPARTPKAMVDKMQADFSRVLKMSDVQDRLVSLTIEPIGSKSAELEAFLKREIAKWSVVVKESGAKAD